MHLTVGYLATPTGDDGIALASALARTFDATVDVVIVVREELPDGHPGRAEFVEGAGQRLRQIAARKRRLAPLRTPSALGEDAVYAGAGAFPRFQA